MRDRLLEPSEDDRRIDWTVGSASDLTGDRIARVIFGIAAGEMVLLHSFEKTTQKTSQHDIDLALKRKQELE